MRGSLVRGLGRPVRIINLSLAAEGDGCMFEFLVRVCIFFILPSYHKHTSSREEVQGSPISVSSHSAPDDKLASIAFHSFSIKP